MVYSRATTSAMAERVGFPVGFLDDILAATRQRLLQVGYFPETKRSLWIGSRGVFRGAITYLGDVWISCTRSRLSGVEESSVWLGSINLPLGNFALGFSVNSTKVRAWACSPRVTALKWNGVLDSCGVFSVCGWAGCGGCGNWQSAVPQRAASCQPCIGRACLRPTQFQL